MQGHWICPEFHMAYFTLQLKWPQASPLSVWSTLSFTHPINRWLWSANHTKSVILELLKAHYLEPGTPTSLETRQSDCVVLKK